MTMYVFRTGELSTYNVGKYFSKSTLVEDGTPVVFEHLLLTGQGNIFPK